MSNQSLVAATVCAVRTRYIQQNLAPSYFQINNGLCEDFALDVIRELRAKGVEAQDFCNENFQDSNGAWDWALLKEGWSTGCPHGLLPREVDQLRFGGHVWVEVGKRFYDSECPEGVSSLFELPIFRRYIVYALRKKGVSAPEVIPDDVVPAPRCPIPNPIQIADPTP
jgi:hypothetical protein